MDKLGSWIDQDFLGQPAIRVLLIVAISMVVAKLVEVLLCRVLLRLAHRTETDFDEELISRLHRPIFQSVVLIGVYLAIQQTGWAPRWIGIVADLIQTSAIFIWVGALLRVTRLVLDGLSRLFRGRGIFDPRTLPLFHNMSTIVIVGGAIYMLLLTWNLDVTGWLASAGVVGLALGFAAKDSLANLFGGIFVIADSPYIIGDFINLDTGERGEVTKIGLRSTRLLTRDDVEITVPNSVIANAKIVNESGGPSAKRRVMISVGVAYGSDVGQVKQVLYQALQSVEMFAVEPEPRVRFAEMGDSALIFRVLCWIDEPVLRGQAIDALNTAVYNALNAAGIPIPFPQRDVHLIPPAQQAAN